MKTQTDSKPSWWSQTQIFKVKTYVTLEVPAASAELWLQVFSVDSSVLNSNCCVHSKGFTTFYLLPFLVSIFLVCVSSCLQSFVCCLLWISGLFSLPTHQAWSVALRFFCRSDAVVIPLAPLLEAPLFSAVYSGTETTWLGLGQHSYW